MPRDPIPLNEQKKEARHFAALLNIRRDFKPFGGRFHINNSTFKVTAFFDNVGDLLWNTILQGGGGGGERDRSSEHSASAMLNSRF